MDLALPCMLNHSATEGMKSLTPQEQVGVFNIPGNTSRLLSIQENATNITHGGNASQFGSENTEEVKESSCGGAAIELDILKLKLNFSYSTKVRL